MYSSPGRDPADEHLRKALPRLVGTVPVEVPTDGSGGDDLLSIVVFFPRSQDFELEPGDSRYLTKQMQQAWILKRAEQPLSDQRMGQIFKSPGGISASELIKDAKLGDAKVGEAQISERNANFIVVGSKATSRDVLGLIELVRTGVAERMGTELELAVEVW